MQALTAISPVDGRYRDKVDSLANYFSESALIRYRVIHRSLRVTVTTITGIRPRAV